MTRLVYSCHVALVLVAIASWWSLPARSLAQTQDGRGQIDWLITDTRQKAALVRVLHQSIDLGLLRQATTLGDALGMLHEQLRSEGKWLPILLDSVAFANEDPRRDILLQPVSLPPNRKTMTVAEILHHFVDQLPKNNGVWFFGFPAGSNIEITTKGAFTQQLPSEVMSKKVKMEEFKGKLPLREALGRLAEQLGVQLVFDREDFKARHILGERALDVMVTMPADNSGVTLERFLTLALAQIPGGGGTYVLQPDYIEITTHQQAAAMRSLLRQNEMPSKARPSRDDK